MADDNFLLYEKKHFIKLNDLNDRLYLMMDYDERSFDVNMDFQHFHHFLEIHILIDQTATHLIEGDCYPLAPYDIVLLRPALLHKSDYPKGKPRKRLVINFSLPVTQGLDGAYKSILSVFDEPVPILRFPEKSRFPIFGPLNEIFTISKGRDKAGNLLIYCKFIEFLCALYQNRRQNIYVPQHSSDSISHKIYSITSFIHANFQNELSLDFLSQKFYISPYYLSHQFKKITGFTLVGYIQMTRIKNAQQLLLYTNIKITDIAERCGFTSLSQFNRVFNKVCGVSPSRFRQDAQQHIFNDEESAQHFLTVFPPGYDQSNSNYHPTNT